MDSKKQEETTKEESKDVDLSQEEKPKEKPYWKDYQEYLVNLS